MSDTFRLRGRTGPLRVAISVTPKIPPRRCGRSYSSKERGKAMCKCTPEMRTPYCGKPGCEWPPQPRRERLSNPFMDHLGRIWRILERPDGSVALYYTLPTTPRHLMVYDSLDEGEQEAAP